MNSYTICSDVLIITGMDGAPRVTSSMGGQCRGWMKLHGGWAASTSVVAVMETSVGGEGLRAV
jgi:hypothetical protein